MSEQQKRKKEKALSDAWKLKQEQKKKQKQKLLAEGGEILQKKAKKKDKAAKKEESSKKTEQKKQEQLKQPIKAQMQIKSKHIITIQDTIYKKYPQLYDNHESQGKLIFKSISQLLVQDNTVLHISQNNRNKNNIGLSTIINCNFVQIPDFSCENDNQNSQIVCRYVDAGLIMQQNLDKLIIQAYILFSNGSFLAKKGTLNLVILAQYFKIPIIVYCGSWRYCGQNPLSEDQIQRVHGKIQYQQFDWIDRNLINVIVLEVGPLLPSQISYNVVQGYKKYGYSDIIW